MVKWPAGPSDGPDAGVDGAEHDAGLAVALVTGVGQDEALVTAEGEDVVEYLQKPVCLKRLTTSLERVILNRGSQVTRSSAKESSYTARLTGLHVLLAEDNLINQQIARELLECFDVRIDVANNGVEALERVREGAELRFSIGTNRSLRSLPVGSMSAGQKRRVSLAAVVVRRPELWLLDEPTVGVDPQSRNAIFDNLEELKRRGKALLYTTHYMEEVERLADRIVVVDHGRVVADDTLDGLKGRVAPTDGPVTLETVFLAMTGRSLRD